MARLLLILALASSAFAQNATPFKTYKTQEEYCADQPQMPTCIHGKPLRIEDMRPPIYKPPTVKPTTPSAPARATIPMGLDRWRFSHTNPAALMNINISALAKSPLWSLLASGIAGVNETDIAKARAVAANMGQLLISVAPGGMLMLARGDIGNLVRSDPSLQSVRIDEISTLAGDPRSLQFATLRLRRTVSNTTTNLLQQTAIREAMKYDLWFGINPGSVGSLGMGPTFAGLSGTRGLSVGIYLRDQIRVEALIEAPSADIANRMLAAFQRKPGEQTWVTAEGTQVRYIAIADPAHLKETGHLDPAAEKLISSKIAPFLRALASSTSSAPAETPAPKPSGGAIVIQGLSGGTKVIPAQ